MKQLLAREPALAAAVASLIMAVIGLFVGNAGLAGALGGVVLTLLGIRQTVTPNVKAHEKVAGAAVSAATATAANLTAEVVGTAGEITEQGRTVISEVVNHVVEAVR